jgi:hypothetical protein
MLNRVYLTSSDTGHVEEGTKVRTDSTCQLPAVGKPRIGAMFGTPKKNSPAFAEEFRGTRFRADQAGTIWTLTVTEWTRLPLIAHIVIGTVWFAAYLVAERLSLRIPL